MEPARALVRYWCYPCNSWKLPRAADECAAHHHFVVSEAKKLEIDAHDKRVKAQEGLLPCEIMQWISDISAAASLEFAQEKMSWEDYQFCLLWVQDLSKVAL